MIARYQVFEELPGSELLRLERGRDRDSGHSVLIKRPRSAAAREGAIEALRRESAILASLAAAGVPRVVGPGLRDDVLVMEDPGGSALGAVTAGGRVAIGLSLAIGIDVADILAGVHRRGLVHNGLRPDAILCDAAAARAWLVDFSDCSTVVDVLASPTPPLAAAALIYASPERTGRMNRGIDHRSDLYSLGIVLYELLTGSPPFRSDDVLELIHWHIAGTPRPPAEVDCAIPQALSNVVMKLLAKTPEDRYRGAAGLAEDLRSCARQWAAGGSIADFAPGGHDIGEQFIVSRKLYGRDADVAELLRGFDRACDGAAGRPSLTLVAGYSGIGKSSLIQELYKPIVRQRGYFVAGKFDQVRSIPFGAVIQAFRALVRQLLTESEARLAHWRSTLAQALGANAGVLAEVIPEIEFIIGKQPLTVVLGPTEALNRFRMVFQNFVAALARPDHPLVVFLDDLQWADAATLSLFEPLLTSADIRCLFLMGAYRDNEVDAAHPLVRTAAALEAAGVDLRRVALGALRLPDLVALIHDTLHGERADAEPLARLVLGKTGGNPFFVTQFLKMLKDEGYFTFDGAGGRWRYDIDAISGAPLTDNVVDLMTHKIRRLPAETQRTLTLAACIGNPFDHDTLALVGEQSAQAATDSLREAMNEGLILPTRRGDDAGQARDEAAAGLAYSFLHDRVHQAAYALIPAERKQAVHLAVGRLLRRRGTPQQIEERIFDVVQQLNFGRSLIADDAERLDLARLDLIAGRKAKSSTAHEAAAGYFRAGLDLLGEARWESDYELAFALHLEAAECEYLCGRFDAAERRFEVLLQRAATKLDRARVCRLRSLQYENMSRYADALESARQGLALFGVSFPYSAKLKEAALETEIAAIQALLGSRSIASLVDLPLMTDPEIRMVMSIMTDIWASAYILGDPLLARLISATLVRLSLKFGNVEESAYGYVTHAITVGAVRHDYGAAYEFGRLALGVNERLKDTGRRAKICQQFHAHVNFWCRPLQTCIPYAREACRSGLESGDFLYAAYGAGTEPWAAMLANRDLAAFVADYTPHVALVTKLKNAGFADSLKIMLNWARALQGRTRAPLSLSDDAIDEEAYLATYRGNAFFTSFQAVTKLHLCYLFGEYATALDAAQRAGQVVYQLAGTVWPLAFDFWNALTLAANWDAATPQQRSDYVDVIEAARRSFAALAQSCPENFRCPWLLLSAEAERLAGRPGAALELYEEAIGYAGETGALQHLALANELCARLRLARGQDRIAALFVAEARANYVQWGAAAKVEEIDRRYAALLARDAESAPRASPQAQAAIAQAAVPERDVGLDLVSVMKAAGAITGEIELDRLLARLLRITIENAGAERGSLILEHDGEARVQAEGSIHETSVRTHGGMHLAQAQDLPASIINYVRRTSESVVVADAQGDDRFGTDPYIVRHRPRSIMCVPVIKQGRLVGSLYLEHNKLYGAFTPERIQVVQLLSAEAAISLENARLFDGLKREIHERSLAQQELRAALTEVERLKAELEAENLYLRRDLIVNVSHDLRTPLTSLRGYLETLLMKQDSLSGAEHRSYLEIAAHQSARLAGLVDELLELARLDFKGLALNLEPVQLAELACDAMDKFRLGANEAHVTLAFDLPQDIPLVHADVGLLERVFDNLIANALAHTPAGGEIRLSVVPAGGQVQVRVQDTGSGIDEADLPHIFNRFYRADKSRNNASGGAGLGLAIAKRIVELHDGHIAVESRPAQGACFSFTLPAGASPEKLAA